MYDTLMQMGRWFGYRLDYSDVCRLYTTAELTEWFRHITDAAEKLHEEFDLVAARLVGLATTPVETDRISPQGSPDSVYRRHGEEERFAHRRTPLSPFRALGRLFAPEPKWECVRFHLVQAQCVGNLKGREVQAHQVATQDFVTLDVVQQRCKGRSSA